MMLFNRAWFVIVMMLSIIALPIRVGATSPTVIFSEIAWAGSSISSSDELIELTNLTADSIDVTGWTITGAGSSGKTLTLPQGTIAPYSTYLITNYENGNTNTALSASANFTTSTLSLPNDGFTLALIDALGIQIDTAGGSGTPFAGGSGATAASADGRYRSMVRIDGLIAGSQAVAWTDATVSSGFVEGVTDLGTPGTVEAQFEQVVEDAEVVDAVEAVEVEQATEVDTQTEEIVTEVIVETEEVTEEAIEEAVVEDLVVEEVEVEAVQAVENVEIVEAETSIEEDAVVEVEIEEIIKVETTVPESTVSYSPGVILINEFVVDPLDEETEWIELVNRSDQTITLTDWTLEDATGNTTDLSSLTITPGSYAVVDSPNGRLNNDGDTIILRDATNLVIDFVSYGDGSLESPEDGMALARNSTNDFELSETTTPGEVNVIFVEQEVVEANEDVEVDEVVVEVLSVQSDLEVTSSATGYIGSTTLRFSSLYPNTTGSDETEEYIEITNTGTESIDLFDWFIEDGSTDRYTFSQSQIIEAKATAKILRTDSGIALNNTGDTLELRDPNGEIVDTVSYDNAAKGSTYTLTNDAWMWSGTVFVAEAVTTSSSASVARTISNSPASQTSSKIQTVTIEQVKNLSDGTRVQVRGIVTVLPGSLARQTFYIMDETGGIQIYFYNADFPELTVGQSVYVTGEMSTSHGERRIKMHAQTDLATTQQNSMLTLVLISIPEINNDQVGSLITTKGLVQSRENGKLVIEETGSELIVSLKSNPEIDAARFERGDRITVTGVLVSYDGELRIRPRMDEDIVINESAVVSLALATDESGKSMFETSQTQTGLFLLLTTTITLGLLALYRNYVRRQPTLSTP